MTGSGKSAEVAAQAKLNLALRILGRDTSGYHPLETLFLRLELADTVHVRPTDGRKHLEADSNVGSPEANLGFIAAARYAAATGWPAGWEIQIEKRIPVGAGLGGGSADAGAVLRGLNAIAPSPINDSELQDIGAAIGADVAFMTGKSPFALGEGYGEKLTDLPAPTPRTVALCIPAFAVSTRDAYAWVDSDGAMRADRKQWNVADTSWAALEGITGNDFTPVVSRRHPEIAKLRDWLLAQGAAVAEMTGSGSVVFGIFDKKPEPGGFSLPVAGKLLWTSTSNRVVEPRLMG